MGILDWRSAVLVIVLATLLTIFSATQTSEWIITTNIFGNRQHESLLIVRDGEKLTGRLANDKIEGTWKDEKLNFRLVLDKDGGEFSYEARFKSNSFVGNITQKGTGQFDGKYVVEGRRIPDAPTGPPATFAFKPVSFSNLFSADIEPVSYVRPGDTIRTSTIDSGGVDEKGVTRALYGNPQTGPFFVRDAEQGDLLAFHIKKLTLNRDYADSLDAIGHRALDSKMAIKAKGLGKNVRWSLDRVGGFAFPEKASEGLKNYKVALRPMLGCVGVAPAFGFPPMSAGDCGRFGGNLDLNDVTEGATVFLQVEQPGALLYFGDAHAAQGDGETTDWGLETSMDVEFIVEVMKKRATSTPRVETQSHLISVGMAGSLDESLKTATAGLTQWLEQDYELTMSDIALILGTSLEYKVSQIASRSVGVAAKLNKRVLAGLPRRSLKSTQ